MKIRTSDSHPIRVDWLHVPHDRAVGMTLAPGVHDVSSAGFRWERDLARDLAVLRDEAGADVLVTLMETHEFGKYGVPDLPEAALIAGLEWIHFPIVDVQVPSSTEAVRELVNQIVALVDAGKRVVLHCRGGLGRTGTIAACYLLARGLDADAALAMLAMQRSSRAPETPAQKDYVRRLAARWASASSPTLGSTRDQARRRVRQVEDYVAAHPDAAFQETDDGEVRVEAPPFSWMAGRFLTPTLGELKARLAKRDGAGQARPTLSRLAAPKPQLDIGYLQATAPPDTLFQAASQFNCLESPGAHITPVRKYLDDPTQGPRAAISALPGTLVRHYRCPAGDGTHFVQSAARELNLLEKAAPGSLSGVQHGYLRTDTVADPAALAQALTDHFDDIQVGIQAGVEVVLGADWVGPVEGDRRIDQVYTSTVALSYSRTRDRSAFLPVVRQVLRAAYLGTLLAAIDLGDRRVVLTMIGGGAFGNPTRKIVDAIEWAVDAAAPYCATPLDVIVNDYSGSDELQHLPAVGEIG